MPQFRYSDEDFPAALDRSKRAAASSSSAASPRRALMVVIVAPGEEPVGAEASAKPLERRPSRKYNVEARSIRRDASRSTINTTPSSSNVQQSAQPVLSEPVATPVVETNTKSKSCAIL